MIQNKTIILSSPQTKSKVSVEEALLKRRSIREYKDESLSQKQISQILWAAQGITDSEWGARTSPSAGALYPLEVYLVTKKIKGIKPGVYQYLPEEHKLKNIFEGDISDKLTQAALGQTFITEAAMNLVITAFYTRTTRKYGERGIRYVHMEAGHVAQNVYLQVVALGLGAVVIGAFSEKEVKKILNLSEEETPLYIIPVGKI
ncbi:nitroreductase [Parcubacteria bacterium DG_74_3]|nr:MAG: nitroreductase [Parcubacteria bacterium DG_74_3]